MPSDSPELLRLFHVPLELDLRIGGQKLHVLWWLDEETVATPQYLQHYIEKLFHTVAAELKEKGLVPSGR